MSDLSLALYGFVCLFVSFFSGAAGAGGGFIVTPLAIILGLTPAQAVATGKVSGFSLSVAAVSGMKRKPQRSKRLIIVICLLALVTGLIAPRIIVQIDNDTYRTIIGTLLLLLIPLLIWKSVGLKNNVKSRKREILGLLVLEFFLLIQGVFSTGLGTFVSITLMTLFGMDAIDANVTKRISQITLNAVITLGLIGTGLIVWKVAIAASICSVAGGYLGGKTAIKKGNSFVMAVFIIMMFLSGVFLLVG